MSRERVVAAAAAEIGPDTHEKRIRYWESALGHEVHHFEEIQKLAWCGGFALYCLHTAGLARDVFWKLGAGFLLQKPHPLKTVKLPLPGDIGYDDLPYRHHYIVERVDGDVVHSIDGNQPDVRRKKRPLGDPELVYFSIAPFLQLRSPVPPKWPQPVDVQRAVNGLIMRHTGTDAPRLLAPDGIIGPLSTAALKWAQRELGIPVTGNPDSATCNALGLS